MLVEDEDLVRRAVRRTIESYGYEVEDFSHGLSAFKQLVELNACGDSNHYALILSDVKMPEMNGLAFASECSRVASETPLVLMSGLALSEYPANVKEVLLKPCRGAEYKRVIEKYT